MSDELENLQRSLEQATAPIGERQGNLDPQTAEWRETWLAFGQLLGTEELSAGPSLARLTMPTAPRRHRRLAAISGLLVAAVSLAAVAAWLMIAGSRQLPVGPSPENVAVKTHQGATAPAATPERPAPANDIPQWNDTIDDQLAQVGRQVIRVQQRQLWQDNAVSTLQYGVEQLQQEIKDSQL